MFRIIFSKPAVHQLVNGCSCPSNDSPDDMIIGLCAKRLSITIITSAAFHQARPNDYSQLYLERIPAISFHKFYDVDPYAVYMTRLHVDKKKAEDINHSEL
ncbi:hypothetical protein AB6A40_001990 [Gnathostoma spinigerum]|uniref:Fringe-like glycosyltransferase domain-containing protein n=1 Tax=Gnathostoma spinigerum TaxID=75299 RepID=A0ABD6ED34_9BILA